MMPITAEELNYLVFRYLTESGFTRTAFALGYEGGINKSAIDGNLVPPGALVKFVQKGIQYLELEANLNVDDLETDEEFQFLNPMDLLTKDVHELKKIIEEKKENIQRDKSKGKDKEIIENGVEHRQRLAVEKEKAHGREKEKDKQQMEIDKEQDKEWIEKEKEKEKAKGKEKENPPNDVGNASPTEEGINGRIEQNGTDGGLEMQLLGFGPLMDHPAPMCRMGLRVFY